MPIDFNPDYQVPDLNERIETISEADQLAGQYNSFQGCICKNYQTDPGKPVLGVVIALEEVPDGQDPYLSDEELTQVVMALIATNPRIKGLQIFGRVVPRNIDGYTPNLAMTMHQRYEKPQPVVEPIEEEVQSAE